MAREKCAERHREKREREREREREAETEARKKHVTDEQLSKSVSK